MPIYINIVIAIIEFFNKSFCDFCIFTYLCSVKGHAQGSCRTTERTSNKATRGNISFKLVRVTVDGGIFFAHIRIIQNLSWIESEFDEVIGKLFNDLSESDKKFYSDMLDGDIREYSYVTPLELENEYQSINTELYDRQEAGNNRNIPQRYVQPLLLYPTETGKDLRQSERQNGASDAQQGKPSTMVSSGTGETVQEVYDNNGRERGTAETHQDRNKNDNLSLLHQVRREIEGFLAENPSSKLSPHQKRLLAEKLAISREVAYRRARQQRLINSLGLNEGRATTLDDVAKTFEKTNKDKEVAALFEKILAVNKRLGTSLLSPDEP